MKPVLLFVVAAVGLAAGCPFAPECKGDANTTLAIAGEKCDGCTVDFGDVSVPLQEHRRIDIQQGCEDEIFEPPTLSGDAAFTLSNFQFPAQVGATGFAEVSFTATDEGERTATLDLPASSGPLEVDLLGNGVPP